MKGTKIKRAYTLNSMYANNQIALEDKNGEQFRIHTDELLKLINTVDFEVEMKRKYNHLTIKE